MPKDDNLPVGGEPVRTLPDPKVCRAAFYGAGDLFTCLVPDGYCKHRLAYGGVKFCSHPKNEDIARRTKPEPAPANDGQPKS